MTLVGRNTAQFNEGGGGCAGLLAPLRDKVCYTMHRASSRFRPLHRAQPISMGTGYWQDCICAEQKSNLLGEGNQKA